MKKLISLIKTEGKTKEQIEKDLKEIFVKIKNSSTSKERSN